MTQISTPANVVTLINVFTVEPARQEALVSLLNRATDETIRHLPGFVSANIQTNVGLRLYEVVTVRSSNPVASGFSRKIRHDGAPRRGRIAVGAAAAGALALGAFAIGALAIGRLAVGALAVKRGWVRTLAIEDLAIDRLTVRELAGVRE